MPFCGECGNKYPDNLKFCPHCGIPNALISETGESQPGTEATPSPGTPGDSQFKTIKRASSPLYGAVRLEALPEGYEIDGRYEVEEKLGQGGFGAVYRVHDRQMGVKKALKVIPESVASDREAMADLQAEARTMVSLNNENIVRVYDIHNSGSIKYLDMEYVEGRSLSDLKIEHEGKRLPEAKVKELALKIAKGMGYAHNRNVIHKDIKPQNIMVKEGGRIKIMDFGISESVRTSMSRIRNSSSSGKLVYMSPEQVRGEDIGKESDIYSFGAMLYELLSGHPPFYKGAIEYQIFNEPVKPLEYVSEGMNRILQKCLAKDYRERYRDFREVIDALEGKPAIEQEKAESILPPREHKSVNKKKILILVIVLLLIAAIGGFAYRGYTALQEKRAEFAVAKEAAKADIENALDAEDWEKALNLLEEGMESKYFEDAWYEEEKGKAETRLAAIAEAKTGIEQAIEEEKWTEALTLLEEANENDYLEEYWYSEKKTAAEEGKRVIIIIEDFESYTVGHGIALQNSALWRTWSGAIGEDPVVSNEQAFAGSSSVEVVDYNDCVLDFGDKTTGCYQIVFKMYVVAGKSGYFNLLHDFAGDSSEWAMEMFFNTDGSGDVRAEGSAYSIFTFNHDEWFTVNIIVDLDDDFATLYIGGIEVRSWQWSKGNFGTGQLNQLDAMNICGWHRKNRSETALFFVDNVAFIEQFPAEHR